MDILIAGFGGALLVGACWFVVHMISLYRRDEAHLKKMMEVTYKNFYKRFQTLSESGTADRFDYSRLQQDVQSPSSNLTDERRDELLRLIEGAVQKIKEKEREVVAPKLAQFQALKGITDEEQLFHELHRISVGDTGVITYNELDSYGDVTDTDWLDDTYEKLLVKRFRRMLIAAREGTTSDYQEVMKLWEELREDGVGRMNREEFVIKHFADEWNQMIVRSKRELDWNDDLFAFDSGDEQVDNAELVRKAREEHDLLSMRVVIKLFEDNDYDFDRIIAESVVEELKTELEVQYFNLGFKSGENERSV